MSAENSETKQQRQERLARYDLIETPATQADLERLHRVQNGPIDTSDIPEKVPPKPIIFMRDGQEGLRVTPEFFVLDGLTFALPPPAQKAIYHILLTCKPVEG